MGEGNILVALTITTSYFSHHHHQYHSLPSTPPSQCHYHTFFSWVFYFLPFHYLRDLPLPACPCCSRPYIPCRYICHLALPPTLCKDIQYTTPCQLLLLSVAAPVHCHHLTPSTISLPLLPARLPIANTYLPHPQTTSLLCVGSRAVSQTWTTTPPPPPPQHQQHQKEILKSAWRF